MQPYDKQMIADEIVEKINKGESPDTLAVKYGFAHKHSMDSLLRRKGYKCAKGKYYKEPTENPVNFAYTSVKAETVANQYNTYVKSGLNIPEGFYKEFGFADKREMQDYLLENGVRYNMTTRCYEADPEAVRKKQMEPENTLRSEERKALLQNMEPQNTENTNTSNEEQAADNQFQRYLPFLETLYQHKEQLLPILVPNAMDKVPPRISIGGQRRIKSVYIASALILLLDEYCSKTGLTIREVVEVSLVEYFSKYGYEKEIDHILNR